MGQFKFPDFSGRSLEFRCLNDEVAIYGTRQGLLRLAEFCTQLANGPAPNGTNHMHLEDYEVLTQQSLRAAIGVFDRPPVGP
jgi:hypothetical protein